MKICIGSSSKYYYDAYGVRNHLASFEEYDTLEPIARLAMCEGSYVV